MQLEIQHPSAKNLSFIATYFPAQKATGEYKYSLGDPPMPESFEVEKIFWRDNDVTEFCLDFCDNLFERFSEELAEFKQEGRLKEFRKE